MVSDARAQLEARPASFSKTKGKESKEEEEEEEEE